MAGPEIVGRDDDLGAIDPFLDGLSGAAGALVFEGGPGIGKTTVWRHAVRRVAARGFTVLVCRPVEPEAKLAFASLADLFDPVADAVLPHLPEPQRRAFEVALVRATPEGAPPSPRAVATAALSALRWSSDARPVVLAIDDQQWLDRASAAALAFALRRIGERRVGVITTARDEPDGQRDPLGLGAAFGDRLLRRRLGPLSASALHHVIREHLGQVLPRPTLRRITDTSGGNPFFALELARTLADGHARPGPGEPMFVPDTLASLTARRLERLPSPALEVLQLAAATVAPTIALLRRAAGTDAADDALAQAERARIVELHDGRVAFTHPLLAAAVESSASPVARRAVHARLASLVTDPEQHARHLALAAASPDEGVARALDAAATLARRRGSPDTAAELQERAARLTPADDGPARRLRRVQAAEHAFHAGDFASARTWSEAVLADGATGHERAPALHVLGRIRGQEDAFADAITHLEDALAHCEDPTARVAIRLDLAYMTYNGGDVHRALEVNRTTAIEAERLGDAGLLASALAIQVIGRFMAGLGSRGADMDRALALEDRTRECQMMLRPSAIAGLLAVYEARIADAETLLRDVCERAQAQGEESGIPFLLFNRSRLAWLRGELETAVALAEDALLLAGQVGSDRLRTLALVHRSRAHAARGDVEAARADLAEARELITRTGNMPAIPWLLASEGLLALALGDAGAAAEALAPLVALIEANGVREPMQAYFLPDAIEALIRLGEIDRAAALLDAFQERAIALERPWAVANALRCRSLLAATRGDLDAALAAADQAVARSEPLGMPIDLGRAFLVLGQVRRRRGERRLARESLERGRDLFAASGARPWVDRADEELGRIPIRRAAGDDLTPTEARVATLAAEGKTNREVAKALFMSPKTVEANLSRVYGKLGIRSRAELGARMAAKK